MGTNANKSWAGIVLTVLGSIWLAFVVLRGFGVFDGLDLPGVGGGIFLPLALMFGGRILRRGSRADETDEGVQPRPNPPVSPFPDLKSPPPPPPRQPSPPRQLAPKIEPQPVKMEDLAEAVRFDVSGADVGEDEAVASPADTHIAVPSGEDTEPMTSAEMVAEAKRRYSSDS
ncbi:MAG: hypothetical protein WBM90_11285 [Acidimicrobiia bacterium]